MSDLQIRINNITDYHLSDFLNSPQSFWKKHLLKQEKDSLNWRNLVELTVNQVMKEFFSLPPAARSTSVVLRLINRYWNKKVDLFHSLEHYFDVLGSMTTHLIQSLAAERNVSSPLSTNEKMSVKIPEWDLNLTMTIPLAIWEQGSFTIKKFVVDENPELTRSWTLFTIFFCHHAFSAIPTKLEVTNILSGTHTVEYPNSTDYLKAKNYLDLVKETMKDPTIYFHHLPRIIN